MSWGSEYGWSLESVGIGPDDLYQDENGDRKLKDNNADNEEFADGDTEGCDT